jgi:filamentous hemagglutinin
LYATYMTANGADMWDLAPQPAVFPSNRNLRRLDGFHGGWYLVGADNNGYSTLVDLQSGSTLVSLKTVDTTGTTWLPRMERIIDQLGSSGATVNGTPANMVLDLRVQLGGRAAAQSLVSYGASRGVTVTIKAYPQ